MFSAFRLAWPLDSRTGKNIPVTIALVNRRAESGVLAAAARSLYTGCNIGHVKTGASADEFLNVRWLFVQREKGCNILLVERDSHHPCTKNKFMTSE